VALLAVGLAASALAAHVLAGNDAQRAHARFEAAADAAGAVLADTLQREEDLVISARVYLAGDIEGPNETERGFLQWAAGIEALARYPEVVNGGEVQLVPRARLAAFAAARNAEPAAAGTVRRRFTLTPAGRRPFYCFASPSFARSAAANTEPPGVDYCAQPADRAVVLQARDTGLNAYAPVHSAGRTLLSIDTPLYRGNGVPSTLAGRRARFRGVFGTTIVPQVVLSAARRGRGHMTIVLRQAGSPQVDFRSGAVLSHPERTTRALRNGWVMEASAPAVPVSIAGDPNALGVLVGNSTVALLLSLLVYVLGTGRARAVAMVEEKTLEINHQALHDALTGLPNRALVLDRAERMLARARRDPGLVTAALFVDIDRFKSINDNFGHAAGDRLLVVAGERLVGVLRGHDTVGRLGGDEFVVLLQSSSGEASPQAIAERIIGALRQAGRAGRRAQRQLERQHRHRDRLAPDGRAAPAGCRPGPLHGQGRRPRPGRPVRGGHAERCSGPPAA
jgi:diguanylate cyclase (GGDEF)-like protein